MNMNKTKECRKTLAEILADSGISPNLDKEYKLVLWNDDVNSFNIVIVSLIEILNFSIMSAEKTAWKIHISGSDVIKTGSKDSLVPYKKLLEERQLTVTIEE
jgi:ATP-dependent Clp protease adaptor protein ClpS